jgi:hypothetical protein
VRNRLSLKERDPNYHYRIVNVKDDRVEQFKEQGYEVVDGATIGDKRVDTASALGSATEISVGGGVKAVLMRQNIEDYKADQAMKQAQIDELESQMSSEAAKRT